MQMYHSKLKFFFFLTAIVYYSDSLFAQEKTFPDGSPEWLIQMFFKSENFSDKEKYFTGEMKDESIHSLPILILSRKVDRASIQAYSELGIEFVFQKPVNLANFKLAVEKSLKKGIKGNGAKPI